MSVGCGCVVIDFSRQFDTENPIITCNQYPKLTAEIYGTVSWRFLFIHQNKHSQVTKNIQTFMCLTYVNLLRALVTFVFQRIIVLLCIIMGMHLPHRFSKLLIVLWIYKDLLSQLRNAASLEVHGYSFLSKLSAHKLTVVFPLTGAHTCKENVNSIPFPRSMYCVDMN